MPDSLSRIFGTSVLNAISLAAEDQSATASLDPPMPSWLAECTKDDGTLDEEKAWQAAISEFHNIDHRGINRTQEYATACLRKHNLKVP